MWEITACESYNCTSSIIIWGFVDAPSLHNNLVSHNRRCLILGVATRSTEAMAAAQQDGIDKADSLQKIKGLIKGFCSEIASKLLGDFRTFARNLFRLIGVISDVIDQLNSRDGSRLARCRGSSSASATTAASPGAARWPTATGGTGGVCCRHGPDRRADPHHGPARREDQHRNWLGRGAPPTT